jgi:ubiquinone/menaquinone biosynthesis C-methylase UbiE
MVTDSRHKSAAVDQWTADPCEARSAAGTLGSRVYFERLLEARRAYGPWLDEALDYSGACGLQVLDVGCGQGIDLARYSLAGARVTGVDLTARHVELASAHLDAMGLEGDVITADAEQLPFPDDSFDRASSNGVMHHTPDILAALREIRRVLRPGGQATVIVYNRRSLHYWLNQVLYEGLWRRRLLSEGSMAEVLSRGVEYSSIGARPLVRVFSTSEMRALLRRAGFADLSTEVRHFQPTDAFPAAALARVLPALRGRGLSDRVGRVAGWYIVARGASPGV